MKLLLFGGTFDPPHTGHLSILKNAIQAVKPDRVLVIPANQPPHKQGGDTPAALRLEMCECFLPLFGDMLISDMEIARGGKSYTYETVRTLQAQYPGAALYLCIGSDMLLSFTSWRRYSDILAAVTLVVQNREREDIEPARQAAEKLAAEGGRVVFASGVVRVQSSTWLREQIAAGRDVYSEIPPPADHIVRENGLYRTACVTVGGAKALAKQALSDKRYRHVKNVAATARQLAQRYGENPERAALAAWLHDIVKERSREDLLQLLGRDGIIAGSTAERPFPIWHGPCAAIYAKTELGVCDTEVLDALACHTTGRAGMTRLDKILYLADMTSAEREYPGVDGLRREAARDLDTAVIKALEWNLAHLRETGKPLDEETVAAYNWMKDQKGNMV